MPLDGGVVRESDGWRDPDDELVNIYADCGWPSDKV